MFATDQAPGVYYQTVDAGSPPVTPLRTDIAAFVGIAERGPVDVPVPVESWQQFVSWFGGCIAGRLPRATPSAGSSRTAAGAAGWSGSRPTTRLSGRAAATADARRTRRGPVWRVARLEPRRSGATSCTLAVRERNRTPGATRRRRPGRPLVPRCRSVAGFDRGDAGPAQPGRVARSCSCGSSPRSTRSTGRVYWVHPEPGAGLPYDAPLHGLRPGPAGAPRDRRLPDAGQRARPAAARLRRASRWCPRTRATARACCRRCAARSTR